MRRKCGDCGRLLLKAEDKIRYFTFGEEYGVGTYREHFCRPTQITGSGKQ